MNRGRPTCYASEELFRKLLDMRTGKGNKAIGFEKVEDALAVEIGDDADMVPKVKAVSKVDAPVSVVPVVRGQSREDS